MSLYRQPHFAALVFATLTRIKCPEGDIQAADALGSSLEMKVNGEEVKSLESVGESCFVLGGGDSSENIHTFQPKADGTYAVEVKVNNVKADVVSHLRISSMVLL